MLSMCQTLSLALLVLALISRVTAEGVIELTSMNFDSSIKDGSAWLVEFHAPWCKHCQSFAPSYEQVAQALHSDEDVDIKVAKIDGDSERAIKSRFEINHFPCFYLLDGWNVYEFTGARSTNALIDFAKKQGKYKDMEPVPMLSSPFGPMGLVQGWLMQAGVHAMNTYYYWIDERGFSPFLLVCALVMGGITCGVFFMIALTVVLSSSSKPKED